MSKASRLLILLQLKRKLKSTAYKLQQLPLHVPLNLPSFNDWIAIVIFVHANMRHSFEHCGITHRAIAHENFLREVCPPSNFVFARDVLIDKRRISFFVSELHRHSFLSCLSGMPEGFREVNPYKEIFQQKIFIEKYGNLRHRASHRCFAQC